MSTITVSVDFDLYYQSNTFYYNDSELTTPVTIVNTGQSIIVVNLYLDSDINNSSHYIILNSSKIHVKGQGTTTYVEVSNYPGLIQTANSDLTNITVSNFVINGMDFFSASLAERGGWICQENFANATISHCSSFGYIFTKCGGIVGANAQNCSIDNCHFNGFVIDGSGGIVGGDSSNCLVQLSSSTGDIYAESGGIFGQQCYNCEADFCHSSGNILEGSGGIFASRCNDSQEDQSICFAYGCYSEGTIQSGSGGIFGVLSNIDASVDCNTLAVYCFSLGDMYGDEDYNSGGIFGQDTTRGETDLCYSIGSIGYGCGGIYGAGATNCPSYLSYSIGTIGENAGGIFGIYSSSSCLARFCYSTQNIDTDGGGIFGSQSSDCVSQQCYTLGSFDTDGGSIFGSNSQNCEAESCYTLYGTEQKDDSISVFGSNADTPLQTNVFVENDTHEWNDVNADESLNTIEFTSVSNNSPFLLNGFNTNQILFPTSGIGVSFVVSDSIRTINEEDTLLYTNNGERSVYLVTGFYNLSPDYINGYQDANIYGYIITEQSITVKVSQSGGTNENKSKEKINENLNNNNFVPSSLVKISANQQNWFYNTLQTILKPVKWIYSRK
jgi:hypothetical protein